MFHFQHGPFARCGPLLRVNQNAFETLDKNLYFAGHLFLRRGLSSGLRSQHQVVPSPCRKVSRDFQRGEAGATGMRDAGPSPASQA